tara:strand:- start:438 stop:617 length:180 start_codon:yes stop_codon:yes gene_type:complete
VQRRDRFKNVRKETINSRAVYVPGGLKILIIVLNQKVSVKTAMVLAENMIHTKTTSVLL